jgi:hypothetical protein
LRANQLNFLRAVKAAVLRHGRITMPHSANHSRAWPREKLFAPQDIYELLTSPTTCWTRQLDLSRKFLNACTYQEKVDELWNRFWAAGLTNPLVAVEQITYLLFLKRLEDIDLKRQQRGFPPFMWVTSPVSGVTSVKKDQSRPFD